MCTLHTHTQTLIHIRNDVDKENEPKSISKIEKGKHVFKLL